MEKFWKQSFSLGWRLIFCSLLATNATHATNLQAIDPFADLRGRWGGTGTMSFRDGDSTRISCNANYTGTASQLGLVIDCKSNISNINMNARLSVNQGRLLGTWKEETYKAIGTIVGTVKENQIRFTIGGNVVGSMQVKFNKQRQVVQIRTAGISLKDLSISLRRR